MIADKLSKTPPESVSLGKIDIGPVIDANTVARQKATMATMKITKTVADLLDNITTFKLTKKIIYDY